MTIHSILGVLMSSTALGGFAPLTLSLAIRHTIVGNLTPNLSAVENMLHTLLGRHRGEIGPYATTYHILMGLWGMMPSVAVQHILLGFRGMMATLANLNVLIVEEEFSGYGYSYGDSYGD